MGNTVEQYRAAIGSFYCARGGVFKRAFFNVSIFEYLYTLLSLISKALVHCLSIISKSSLDINFYFQFFTYILLLGGDIETNTGPDITNEEILF